MTVVGFPSKPVNDDWIWEKDLGKPYEDINGKLDPAFARTPFAQELLAKIANPPEQEVNDLARYNDKTNPTHYQHKGVECIEVTEHMNFNLGNVVKYCYRCDLKGGVEDLMKAKWYLEREIARRGKGPSDDGC